MDAEAKAVEYKARLLALINPEKQSPSAYAKDNAYGLYSDLKYAPLAKSILSQQNTPEAQEVIAIVKFYLGYFSALEYVYDCREIVAETMVEFGYLDEEIVSYLNPWVRLFFELKKSGKGLEELQQWFFDAGFDQNFTGYNKEDLVSRLAQPNQDLDLYSGQYPVIYSLFGDRICAIDCRNPDSNSIALLTKELLNSIKASLNITEEYQLWDEEERASFEATLVADKLLDYALEIPNDKTILTRFTYNNQVYGFYHSDDPMSHMFIVMRNIDCFLSYIGRPERVFTLPSDREGVMFLLAEPEKFRKLAEKIGFKYRSAEDEANFQNEDYDMLPSLSTLQTRAIKKPELHLSLTPEDRKTTQQVVNIKPVMLQGVEKPTAKQQPKNVPQSEGTLFSRLVEFYGNLPRVVKLSLIGLLLTLVMIGWVEFTRG